MMRHMIRMIPEKNHADRVCSCLTAAVLVLVLFAMPAVPGMAGEAALVGLPEGQSVSEEAAMQIEWNPAWEYAENSMIHTDPVTLYRASGGEGAERKDFVVAVNAGHGTPGGESVRTLCHPDGTPKVTGGSTAAGETTATAISAGTTMLDGSAEAEHTLSLAMILKEILLERGYDVLMLRENENTQLDNIARTVFANQNADCHLALHYDSTDFDKGAFFMSVPDTASYRAMDPVASCWEKHEQLGACVVQGLSLAGIGVFEGGSMPMDLTQTSYSTIPSIDLEAGDRASDTSYEAQRAIAAGIADGIDLFWQETR